MQLKLKIELVIAKQRANNGTSARLDSQKLQIQKQIHYRYITFSTFLYVTAPSKFHRQHYIFFRLLQMY